jgi:hypothetical protein
MAPLVIVANAPFSPSITVSIVGPSGNIVITMSAPLAAAAGVEAAIPPSWTKPSTRSIDRFHTRTLNPAAIRREAMGVPI